MTDAIDCLVIGAGVVGLAIARASAMRGLETVIVEGEGHIGSWTSSRNSEVIHAGIYYPGGSLKARTCVEGREWLYRYCEAHGVPHRRCGKLIVATEAAQAAELEEIARAAARNGVEDLESLSGTQARALEPAVRATAALHSPSTGIIDSHAYMLALLGDAEDHGAALARNTSVDSLDQSGGAWNVWLRGEGAPVRARHVVNAAGLGAQALASRTDGLPGAHVPPLFLAKGVYFTYAGRTPFTRLIYPAPEAGGLGTHLTLDLAGQARFGPDVEWIDHVDYAVDPGRKPRFEAAIRRFWPEVDGDRLDPGYAGVRPKLSGPGQPPADFVVSGPADHGLEGLVNLFGIESPGLTASLALAELTVARLLRPGAMAGAA